MTRADIIEKLKDLPTWRDNSTEVERDAFILLMRGRHYGYGPLRDAFEWFHEGYTSNE